MLRAVSAATFWATLLFAVAPAMAQDPAPKVATVIQDVVAGQNHENGDARWISVVLSSVSNVCGFTGAERKAALGGEASAEPRALDIAALKWGKWVRATSISDCGDRIYRMKVKFKITEEPDEPKANDGQ